MGKMGHAELLSSLHLVHWEPICLFLQRLVSDQLGRVNRTERNHKHSKTVSYFHPAVTIGMEAGARGKSPWCLSCSYWALWWLSIPPELGTCQSSVRNQNSLKKALSGGSRNTIIPPKTNLIIRNRKRNIRIFSDCFVWECVVNVISFLATRRRH